MLDLYFDENLFDNETVSDIGLSQSHKEMLSKLSFNRFNKRIISENLNLSIQEITDLIEIETLKHTSNWYFPGSICYFYPSLIERRAQKNYICDVTGECIRRGSFYLSYRPFIDNITLHKAFVLKRTILANSVSSDFFPTTFDEFESLARILTYSYELPQNSEYDYYDISTRVGEMSLLELKRR